MLIHPPHRSVPRFARLHLATEDPRNARRTGEHHEPADERKGKHYGKRAPRGVSSTKKNREELLARRPPLRRAPILRAGESEPKAMIKQAQAGNTRRGASAQGSRSLNTGRRTEPGGLRVGGVIPATRLRQHIWGQELSSPKSTTDEPPDGLAMGWNNGPTPASRSR